MDDFDVDTMSLSINKRYEVDTDEGIQKCCGIPMICDFESSKCEICGYIVFSPKDSEATFTDDHNSGPSTSTISVKINKHMNGKSYTVFPSYDLTRDAKLAQEFNNIRISFPWLDDNIVNEAKNIYKKIIIDENITKKKKRKLSIQKACIFIEYQNRGLPYSKIEFSIKMMESETSITKGYTFIYNADKKLNIGLVKYESLELIHGFINRFKIPVNDKIEKFLKNMGNLVRDNQFLHQNKHPECLASGILLYASSIYGLGITDEELSLKAYISAKNIKAYYLFLLGLSKNKQSPYYDVFNLIIKSFVV